MSDEPDEIDAGLAALQDAAPVTAEVSDGAPAGDGGAPPEEAIVDPAQADPAKAGQAPAKAPLKPEEIQQRYDGLKIALKEERQQRRAERAELLAQQQKMERTFQAVQERLQAPQPPQYDPNQQFTYEDAVTEMWQERTETRAQQEQRQRQEQAARAQQEQQAREFQALQTTMNEFEADFRDEAPDYDDAIAHLTGMWDEQFEQMGYSPEQRQALIQNLSANAVAVALQNRRDPAKSIYEAAKKAGYQGKAPVANGADKLALLQRGQEAAKTLSGGGSGVQGEGMSLKQLASLEGAAFDSAMDKLRRNAR